MGRKKRTLNQFLSADRADPGVISQGRSSVSAALCHTLHRGAACSKWATLGRKGGEGEIRGAYTHTEDTLQTSS